MAYDREAVKHKGAEALTNFDLNLYLDLMGELPSWVAKDSVHAEFTSAAFSCSMRSDNSCAAL